MALTLISQVSYFGSRESVTPFVDPAQTCAIFLFASNRYGITVSSAYSPPTKDKPPFEGVIFYVKVL